MEKGRILPRPFSFFSFWLSLLHRTLAKSVNPSYVTPVKNMTVCGRSSVG
jgi:hypothetical protein